MTNNDPQDVHDPVAIQEEAQGRQAEGQVDSLHTSGWQVLELTPARVAEALQQGCYLYTQQWLSLGTGDGMLGLRAAPPALSEAP